MWVYHSCSVFGLHYIASLEYEIEIEICGHHIAIFNLKFVSLEKNYNFIMEYTEN